MLDPAVTNNPYILLIATKQGGHVAFLSAKPHLQEVTRSSAENQSANGSSTNGQHSTPSQDPDRFWAENRVVEFCKLAEEVL